VSLEFRDPDGYMIELTARWSRSAGASRLVPRHAQAGKSLEEAPPTPFSGGFLMRILRGLFTAMLIALISAIVAVPAPRAAGQMTWAVHVSLAPTWFDPRRRQGSSRPSCSLRAARRLVKPCGTRWRRASRVMERHARRPRLRFVLRKGVHSTTRAVTRRTQVLLRALPGTRLLLQARVPPSR